MSSKVLNYLQCVFRRLTRLSSAVALAEKGCFDEVRELRSNSPSAPAGSEAAAGPKLANS